MKYVLPLVAALAACGSPAAQAPAPTPVSALPQVDAAAVLGHVKTLASDEFEGRAPGTPGETKTVAYLIDAFKQLGDTNLKDLKVQGSAPKFTITEVQENPDPRLLRIVKGTVQVPCYLNKPGCPSGSSFNFKKGTNTPVQQPGNVIQAPFQCTVPLAAERNTASSAETLAIIWSCGTG